MSYYRQLRFKKKPKEIKDVEEEKPHKYGAKKVTIDGIDFPSKAEGAFYMHLKSCKNLEIIKMQPLIRLSKAKIGYKPDFYIKDKNTNQEYYVEIKGYQTRDFKIRKRLYIAYGTKRLLILKKVRNSFIVVEDIPEKSNIEQSE